MTLIKFEISSIKVDTYVVLGKNKEIIRPYFVTETGVLELTAVVRVFLESAEQVNLERVLGGALIGLVVVHHHQALPVVVDRLDESVDGLRLPLAIGTIWHDAVQAALLGEGRIFLL